MTSLGQLGRHGDLSGITTTTSSSLLVMLMFSVCRGCLQTQGRLQFSSGDQASLLSNIKNTTSNRTMETLTMDQTVYVILLTKCSIGTVGTDPQGTMAIRVGEEEDIRVTTASLSIRASRISITPSITQWRFPTASTSPGSSRAPQAT